MLYVMKSDKNASGLKCVYNMIYVTIKAQQQDLRL